jgi:hypothetical protein
MFIIDQYQTNSKDGTVEMSEEESVSDPSAFTLANKGAKVVDRRRGCFWYGPTFCHSSQLTE